MRRADHNVGRWLMRGLRIAKLAYIPVRGILTVYFGRVNPAKCEDKTEDKTNLRCEYPCSIMDFHIADIRSTTRHIRDM